jgi:PAS domain S-box-containing protein
MINQLNDMVECISKSSAGILSDLTSKTAIKVLLVDDDEDCLRITKRCLEMHDLLLVGAQSAEGAMEEMKKEVYDAIVSDYRMPGKNGLEFLKELREKGNSIPFIIFTGQGREEVAIKALNLGATGYFSKYGEPEVVFSELAHGIRMAVEKKRAEMEMWQREVRLRAVLACSSDAIIISDLNGSIVDCNEVAMRLAGHSSREELVGKSAFEFISEKDRERALRNLENTIGRGTMKNVEYALLRGKEEFQGELSASVLKDSSGSPIGFVGVLRDITDRKKAEQTVKETEEENRSLVESASDDQSSSFLISRRVIAVQGFMNV